MTTNQLWQPETADISQPPGEVPSGAGLDPSRIAADAWLDLIVDILFLLAGWLIEGFGMVWLPRNKNR